MSFKSNAQVLTMRQNTRPEIISFSVDESAASAVATSTDGVLEGARYGTVLKNGTGDYTINLNTTSRRTPIVIGVAPVTADLTYKVTKTTSSIRVVFANLSGTDTNTDFDLSVLVFGSAVQH